MVDPKLIELNEGAKHIATIAYLNEKGYPDSEPTTVLYTKTLDRLVTAVNKNSTKIKAVTNNPMFTFKIGQPFGDNALVMAKARIIPQGQEPQAFADVWCDQIAKYFKGGASDPDMVLLVAEIEDVAWRLKK